MLRTNQPLGQKVRDHGTLWGDNIKWQRCELFTDESRFSMDFHDGRRLVWREGTRTTPCSVHQSFATPQRHAMWKSLLHQYAYRPRRQSLNHSQAAELRSLTLFDLPRFRFDKPILFGIDLITRRNMNMQSVFHYTFGKWDQQVVNTYEFAWVICPGLSVCISSLKQKSRNVYIYTLGAFAPGAVPGEWRVAWTGAYALITALVLYRRCLTDWQTDRRTDAKCDVLRSSLWTR